MKRYEMTTEYNRYACADEVIPVESADGDWIKFKDYQTATEAAKATGTAGDLPELPQCFGSIDVYHDSGQVTSVDGWTAAQMRGYAIDYAMQLGLAARQPAPVVAVSLTTDKKRELLKCLNGGVEMGWIEQNNALEISSSILAGAQDQKLPALPVKTWQERVGYPANALPANKIESAMKQEIAELRSALAATAAPVLSDERIDWLANCACSGGIAYPSQVKTAIRDALREATTNRSQP